MKRSLQRYFVKHLPGLTALFALISIAAGLVAYAPKHPSLAPATAQASTVNLTGYAWSDNIGWISFSGVAADSSPYGVTVDTSSGALSGYAWSENIGWINFGSNSCGAQATMSGGVLTGWAQAPANSGGWDGCISLSGASPAYGVTLSGSTFTGWAWGSDVVGWISFSGIAADSSPYGVAYGGTPAPTCTLSVTPNPAATNAAITLNYTTTNSPSSGTIKDASSATVYSGSVNASGGVAATSPASAGNYIYTMSVTSLSGVGSCQLAAPGLQAQTDVCTDIAGLQSTLPPGCSGPIPSPSGACVPFGYAWNGSACVVIPPTISPLVVPTRVRAGNMATIKYTVTYPPASCTVVGVTSTTTSFSTTVSPVSGVQGSVNAQVYANTIFTLTCSGVSASATVGITPVFQEQ